MSNVEIVHLAKYYKPYNGGMESVVASISENMKNRSVSVLASDPDNQQSNEVINGVKVIRSKEYFSLFSTPMSPGYIFNSLRQLKNSAVIFHVHLPNPLPNIALFLASFFRVRLPPIVIHWHSDIVKQKRMIYLYRPLMNWLLNKANVIIVTSKDYLDGSEQLRRFRSKCIVVPIGVDAIDGQVNAAKVSELKARYGGKKIIFALGRHVYYKGFEVLINAAKHVDGAVFLIGGKGPDTKIYENMINELGLRDKVVLVGRISDEDVASYYAVADVFCMPSIEKSEAFGVAQLEAMSVGTPVVSTRIVGSGVPWVNKDGESGIVCEPKSAESLSSALRLILENDGLREELGVGARCRFSAMFTTENMTNRIEEIYASLESECSAFEGCIR